MKKLFMFMLTAIILALSGFSQDGETITIGNGTTSNAGSLLPGWYGWHRNVTMYTAEELAELSAGSSITGLAWQTLSVVGGSSATMKIYLTEISEDYINGSQSWSDLVSSAELVYDGACAPASNSWTTFTLEDPYTYLGGNLLVIMDGVACGTTGSCSKNTVYYSSPDANTQSFLACKDNSAMNDNSSISTMGSRNDHYKMNIRIAYEEGGDISCLAISGLTVNNVTSTTANITWTEPEETGSYYIIQYKTSTQSWNSDDVI